MTRACEDDNSKLVEVVTVAQVDDEIRVDNSFVQIWKVKFGHKMPLAMFLLISFPLCATLFSSPVLNILYFPTTLFQPRSRRCNLSTSSLFFGITIPIAKV